jgi:hypothetical protein
MVRSPVFFFAELWVAGFGATLELGRGGDDDVGFDGGWRRRRSSAASHGVIDNRSENLQHPEEGALAIARAAALNDQHNVPALI